MLHVVEVKEAAEEAEEAEAIARVGVLQRPRGAHRYNAAFQ